MAGHARALVKQLNGVRSDAGIQLHARKVIWSPKNGHHKVYYFLTLWRLYEEVNAGTAVHG
jgi:hypothetical protein